MTTTQTPTTITPETAGIIVHTALKSRGYGQNHSEGLVVRSAVKAGIKILNHSEGVVVRSAVKAGGVVVPQ